MEINHGSPEPFYLQLAAILRGRISRGELSGKIPSLTKLAADYDVSDTTVRQAVKVLKGEGLLVARGGKGTYVA